MCLEELAVDEHDKTQSPNQEEVLPISTTFFKVHPVNSFIQEVIQQKILQEQE